MDAIDEDLSRLAVSLDFRFYARTFNVTTTIFPVLWLNLYKEEIEHNVNGHSGHSDGETPGPFPNPADKPVRVPYCTELREHLGTKDRCYAHNTTLFCEKKSVDGKEIKKSGVIGLYTFFLFYLTEPDIWL